MRCTCGNKMVDGNIVRPHAPSCECSRVPFTASDAPQKHIPPATEKQLKFLADLTERVGEPRLPSDLSIKDASKEIERILREYNIPQRRKGPRPRRKPPRLRG